MGVDRKIWQCSERYKVKGVLGCGNRHVDESTLEKAFIMAWNGILENKEHFWRKWEAQEKSGDLLEVYRAKDFQKLTMSMQDIQRMDIDLMLRMLGRIQVYESGVLLVGFFDGTEIEVNCEQV
ncbi:hypothetical protein CG710_020700 [Lachnotalea glycerini]|uniref:Uncharacterized protein n=1 Tax=Lachnotalea glycerini TaxID=1763509 RepID=A0A371J477_9FIRM|nr:hypothetical protein [Lachnotalea glycerini]RDY27488.1 hypothetical protein CG710_020700 [Lachnotalea glycerini]